MKDTVVFDDKQLTDLLREIHTNTVDKKDTLISMIGDLRKYMTGAETAIMFAPIIKEYLDVLVRSDDHLIKIATIVQRIISAESYQKNGGDLDEILSDDEKAKLIDTAKKEQADAIAELDDALNKIVPIAVSGSIQPTI